MSVGVATPPLETRDLRIDLSPQPEPLSVLRLQVLLVNFSSRRILSTLWMKLEFSIGRHPIWGFPWGIGASNISTHGGRLHLWPALKKSKQPSTGTSIRKITEVQRITSKETTSSCEIKRFQVQTPSPAPQPPIYCHFILRMDLPPPELFYQFPSPSNAGAYKHDMYRSKALSCGSTVGRMSAIDFFSLSMANGGTRIFGKTSRESMASN
jgi:hypothetical protein